jgi:hypothetical protein
VPGHLLDANTSMTCPHGGQVTAKPRRGRVTVREQSLFVLDDFLVPEPAVSGCSFQVSGAPSPCLRIQWQSAARRLELDGSPVLLSSSVGICISAAQAPQGVLQVTGHQTEVEAE